MRGFATVNMAGRLTADPEVRYRTNGDAVASFCVAVTRTVKSDFHAQVWTDYIDCVSVGEAAEETARTFKQGDVVEICGRLIQQRWEERGYKKNRLAVDVATMSFIRNEAEVREVECT